MDDGEKGRVAVEKDKEEPPAGVVTPGAEMTLFF
jgi:hypothetical protein